MKSVPTLPFCPEFTDHDQDKTQSEDLNKLKHLMLEASTLAQTLNLHELSEELELLTLGYLL